jgi:proline iminopeptidase
MRFFSTFILIIHFSLLLNFSSAQNTNGSSCAYNDLQETGVKDGGVKMIPIHTPAGDYKVWTKRFGNGPIKVLLLHGGPAMTHEYMECFESFFPQAGIEFYEYDQLGSFYSDQPTDSSLWTVDRFVDEVEQVRKGLGLDHFYLLGHSWGGILAMEYAFKYQNHLAGLIISNMEASIPRYEQYNLQLRSQMRKTLVDSLRGYEEAGKFDDPVYTQLVMDDYYKQHICRLTDWPDPLQRAFKHMNSTIYVMMQGPSEFKTGGRLYHWDRWNDLHLLTVPTLMIGGKYDTMNPADMEAMSKLVLHGRYLFCPEGSHCDMWDDQTHYFPGVIKFLTDVQGGKF